MSWITDVVLVLSLDEVWEEDEESTVAIESEPVQNINTWLAEHNYGRLVDLSETAFSAASKAMQSLILGGAFNYLDEDAFIEVVKTQQWRAPQSVQLLLKSESEDRFTLITVV